MDCASAGTSPLLVCVGAIGVRLHAAFLLLVQPVRHGLQGAFRVRHHVLYVLQLLLSRVDGGVLGHDVAVIVHEDSHGAVAHWRGLEGPGRETMAERKEM